MNYVDGILYLLYRKNTYILIILCDFSLLFSTGVETLFFA